MKTLILRSTHPYWQYTRLLFLSSKGSVVTICFLIEYIYEYVIKIMWWCLHIKLFLLNGLNKTGHLSLFHNKLSPSWKKIDFCSHCILGGTQSGRFIHAQHFLKSSWQLRKKTFLQFSYSLQSNMLLYCDFCSFTPLYQGQGCFLWECHLLPTVPITVAHFSLPSAGPQFTPSLNPLELLSLSLDIS